MLTYEESLAFLNAPVYSQTRPGLAPVTELMHELGDPQDGLKYVHIAGTNGKGSTASFIERILREAGYRTGLYTSPYLMQFTERMRVCGQEISKDDLARLTTKVKAAVDRIVAGGHTAPTIFEMVTAVAFLYFREQKCDIIVLEVGLGGRLDATNIIRESELSVIAAIDFDHMNFLGDTIEEIAYEKAGIIRKNGIVVSFPQRAEAEKVLREVSGEMDARLYIAESGPVLLESNLRGQCFQLADGREFHISLLGGYQIGNAAVAVMAMDRMAERGWKITPEALSRGLENARWPGRFELMSKNPMVLVDGAHNPNGVEALARGLRAFFPGRKFTFIAGVLADKDYTSMLRVVEPLAARFLTVTPDSERALAASELAADLRAGGFEAVSFTSVSDAAETALSEYPDEIICAFGSLYFIGDIRRVFLDKGLPAGDD